MRLHDLDELLGETIDQLPVTPARDKVGAELHDLPVEAHEGIRAKARLRRRLCQLAQRIGDLALAHAIGADGAGMDNSAALDAMRDIRQHAAHDGRHARHHEHIAELEAGRRRHGVEDQARPVGDARHAHAALVDLLATRLVPGPQDGHRIGPHIDAAPESRRYGIRRDVVMRRADPARGEDVVVPRPQLVQCRNDGFVHVRHDAAFAHLDAERSEKLGDGPQVRILRPSRQDLVADEEDCRRHDLGHGPRLRLLHRCVQRRDEAEVNAKPAILGKSLFQRSE